MTEKSKELYDKVKENIGKASDKDTLEGRFADTWHLACMMKSKAYDDVHKYDDSSKEFVDKHREQLTKMREEFVENLDYYVEKCIKMLKKNSCKVYYAKTNEDAHEIFMKELGDNKVLYKSKSTEAKDIGILDVLKKNNIEIKETDLGDVLVQLFEYKLPVYQVGPGIHFLVPEIVAKIKEKHGVDVEETAAGIVQYYRDTYRKELLNDVKVSLTSANAISAEDGCIVLLENEGNISLLTRAVEKHICLVGISKIVPDVFDAVLVTKTIERTNNADLAYISLIYGPSGTSDVRGMPVKGMYGAKEVVVILVDDWRTNAKNSFLREFLRCISCKSCSFTCTASRAFGNTYASKYGLGAAGIIRDYIHNGIEQAIKDGLFLCTSCENCFNWCPAGVNLGKILKQIKKEATEKGLAPPTLEQYRQNIMKEKNPFK